MIITLLLVGFAGGVATCLLALRLLPIKVQFAWSQDGSAWDSVRNRIGFLHPKYCVKCKTNPCSDPFDHEYDLMKKKH